MCKSDNGIGSAVVLKKAEVDATTSLEKKTSHGYIIKTQTIGEKLFQAKEDRMYHHKILGFSALASYAYRFSQMGQRDGNFHDIMALIFVAHHASLNLSSFVFDIPQRRIRGGFRIWPEYRIHSMVFAFRNLACILRLWMLLNTPKDTQGAIHSILNDGLVNWAIVITTCAAADYGSSLSKEFQSNTVRGTDYFDPYANWFASEMQFQLTAVCLSGGYQRYSLHIVGAFIIQFNSFLMTLRRKNVFSHLTLTTTYGIMLLAALLIGTYEDNFTNDHVTQVATFANMGVILRMGLGVDKYLVWTILAVSMNAANKLLPPIMADLPRPEIFYWTILFWITKFICFGLGARKRAVTLKKRSMAEGKEKTTEDVSTKAGYEIVLTAFVIFAALATVDMLDIFEILQ
jgi:hypothetical protein